MTKQMAKCPSCGNSGIELGSTEVTRTFGVRSYTATLTAEVCPHCDEALVSADELKRFEAAIVHDMARSGVQDGASLKWLRKAAGLRAIDLAKLLDVAPETVSRWETGRTGIDRGSLHALGRLAVEATEGRTETADELRSMAGQPENRSHTVKLEVHAAP